MLGCMEGYSRQREQLSQRCRGGIHITCHTQSITRNSSEETVRSIFFPLQTFQLDFTIPVRHSSTQFSAQDWPLSTTTSLLVLTPLPLSACLNLNHPSQANAIVIPSGAIPQRRWPWTPPLPTGLSTAGRCSCPHPLHLSCQLQPRLLWPPCHQTALCASVRQEEPGIRCQQH